jgi:hypothetical protein
MTRSREEDAERKRQSRKKLRALRLEKQSQINRPRQSAYTQSAPPAHPEDAQRNPSKREWAFWPADRQRDWMIARGYWGKDLPDFLK